MKPGIPWSVKGIDNEARDAAKDAARRSGMTLGAWLNSVILEQAEGGEPAQPAPRAPGKDIHSRLDDLSQQLSRLSNRDQDTTAGRYYERSRAPGADAQMLEQIFTRIETSERQTVEALTAVNERLNSFDQQLAQGSGGFPQNPADVPGYLSLETALRNVVDHIEVSERKTRDTLKTIQDKMTDVAHTAAAPVDGDHLLMDAPVIARLESQIADLADRLDRSEESAQRQMRDLMQGEFARLAGRIDQVKQASEAAAQRAQSQAVQASQEDLREIEARMHALLKDAQRQQDSGEAERLRGEMESLNQRLDDLKADAVSERDLQSLRAAIEQLSARVAQGPDLRPLADMDRRLAEITGWLENGRGGKFGEQIADLEQRVFDLDQRLANSMRQQQSSPGLEDVERGVTDMSDRMARTEQQLHHLATLEQSILQLYESVEQNRNVSRELAETAATRAVSRLTQDWSPSGPSGPSPELQALEQALEAVRANAESADQRNQDTLAAVHETLEQIVNKMTELETAREQPLPPAPARGPEAESHVAPESLGHWPIMPPAAPESPPASAAPLAEPPLPEPSVFDDPSLEPQDDFIAAARRAAQEAQFSAHPIAASMHYLGRKKAAGKKAIASRLLSPFRKPEKPLSTIPVVLPAPRPRDDGRRTRLILIGIVLLAAASAFAFTTFARAPKAKAPVIPPAVEQTKPAVKQQQESSIEQGVTPKFEINQTNGVAMNSSVALKSDVGLTGNASAGSLSANAEVLPAGIGPESLRRAAANGNAQAAFIVASRYFDGKAVPQDLAAAARWYQIAAAQGLAPAQYRIGTLFERGKGVSLDPAAALAWYERAAAAGNVRSMHNVAVLYAGGHAGKPNYEKAARWFTAAAAHNVKDSQFNLAVLLERGMGVRRDLADALFWYSLAARQNDPDAAAKGKALDKALPPSVAAEVKARVAAWRPKTDLTSANMVSVTNPDWQEPMIAAPVSPGLPVIAAVTEASEPTDAVEEAQQLLNDLGYAVGEPNGHMGSRTANAIRLFQLQSGMKVTGELSPDLLAQLRAKRG